MSRMARAGGALLTLAGLLALAAPGEGQLPPAPREVHHIHGLAVDRQDSEALYIATHTGLVRLRPSVEPEWIGSFDLMGFTAHPREPNLLYASGHPDLPTYQEQKIGNLGVLVSRDGGRTWRSAALKGEADFHALAYTPRDGGELYGWSVSGRRGLHRISVVRSTVEPVTARGLADVLGLAASPDLAGPLLAGTKAGLMTSRDRGVTWGRVTAIPSDAPVTAVGYHATDGNVVYAYVVRPERGLMRSRDGGTTWESTGFVAGGQTFVVALAVGPSSQIVLATSGSDILRSRDGGRTWQAVLERGRPVPPPR